MDMLQGMAPHLGMKVSPRLVAASYILELSSLELQQVINEELNDNPALELTEKATCGVCGSALQGSICPRCLSQQKVEERGDDAEYSEDYVSSYSFTGSTEEEFDPLSQVAAQLTLSERLMGELQSMLPKADVPIAEFLVGSLDDNGYLKCTVDEVASLFDVSQARVEMVLGLLQSLEPPGIGARDLRECLLIQMQYLAEDGVEIPKYVREIVTSHLGELAEHKYSKIATELAGSHDEILDAGEFIKHRLNPYPAQESEENQHPGIIKSGGSHILPDVIIATAENQEDYEVEVVESKRFFLRISPMYHQLLSNVEREPTRFSEDEKRHIQHYVSRAKLFIANINQRRQTLHRITTCIAKAQKGYLTEGIRHLRPLTRAMVAKELGMHESTVSRATASKYVMLPSGEVIPFSNFFTASLSVRDVIKEMIDCEKTPLTDQEIAAELAKQGIVVARRTVAKYREQLGILPSSLR